MTKVQLPVISNNLYMNIFVFQGWIILNLDFFGHVHMHTEQCMHGTEKVGEHWS